jgi:hypothetical protein
MTFTTATVTRIEQGSKQFQGAFTEQWLCNLTVDPASIAAADEDIATFTVPGLALGDIVVGYSAGVNQTVDADINVWVSAANTLSIRISNLHATVALDLATSTWKVLIGRPSW